MKILLRPLAMHNTAVLMLSTEQTYLDLRRSLRFDFSMPAGVASMVHERGASMRAQLEGIAFALEIDAKELDQRSHLDRDTAAVVGRSFLRMAARLAEVLVWNVGDRNRYILWAAARGRPWAKQLWGSEKLLGRQKEIRDLFRLRIRGILGEGLLDAAIGGRLPLGGLLKLLKSARTVWTDAHDWTEEVRAWRLDAAAFKAGDDATKLKPLAALAKTGSRTQALLRGPEAAARYGARHLPIANLLFAPLSLQSDLQALTSTTHSGPEAYVEKAANAAMLAGDTAMTAGGAVMLFGAALTPFGGLGVPVIAGGLALTEAGALVSTAGAMANAGMYVYDHAGDWAKSGWEGAKTAWNDAGSVIHGAADVVSDVGSKLFGWL
jgi:hypothetical protein